MVGTRASFCMLWGVLHIYNYHIKKNYYMINILITAALPYKTWSLFYKIYWHDPTVISFPSSLSVFGHARSPVLPIYTVPQ